jgi:hypothetical protein
MWKDVKQYITKNICLKTRSIIILANKILVEWQQWWLFYRHLVLYCLWSCFSKRSEKYCNQCIFTIESQTRYPAVIFTALKALESIRFERMVGFYYLCFGTSSTFLYEEKNQVKIKNRISDKHWNSWLYWN